MPAILKGWADRVLVMGRVYGAGKIYDDGPFKGKRAMLSVTTGGPEEKYRPGGLSGDINQILFPINHGILRFTGLDVLHPFIAYGPAHLNHAERKTYIDAFLKRLENIETDEPIEYTSIRDYKS